MDPRPDGPEPPHAHRHGGPDHHHPHGHDHHHDHPHGGGVLGWLRHTFAHSHDVHEKVDDAMATNERGIWALKISLVGLGATALFQQVVIVARAGVRRRRHPRLPLLPPRTRLTASGGRRLRPAGPAASQWRRSAGRSP